MKISFRLILAALAATAALTACTKETTPPNFENDKLNPTAEGSRVIAVSFGPQTKTALADDGLQPVFVDGDKILVANGQDEPDTCVVSVKDSIATISTNLTGPLTAVYPAMAAKMGETNAKAIDGVLVFTEQDGTFASANICMAKMQSENDNILSFENKTAVLRFYVDESIGVTSVKVTSSSQPIASDNGKEITVSASGGSTLFGLKGNKDKRICYAAIPQGTYTKLTLFSTANTQTPEPRDLNDVTLNIGTMYNAFIPYYIEVNGQKWAYCNIGAFLPEDYGDYFMWAEVAGHKADLSIEPDEDGYIKGAFTFPETNPDGSRYHTSWDASKGFELENAPYYAGAKKFSEKYKITGDILDAEDDAAAVNWGGGWRMPTKAEFETLLTGTGTSTDDIGEKYLSIKGTNLKLPVAGTGDNLKLDLYNESRYWSSSSGKTSLPYFQFNLRGCSLRFISGEYACLEMDEEYSPRETGMPIRPIYDPAPEVVPEGALSGKFTINADGDQVYFSKGNLYCTRADDGADGYTYSFAFEANQYDSRTINDGSLVGKCVIGGEEKDTTPENTSGLFQWNLNDVGEGKGYGAFTMDTDVPQTCPATLDWGPAYNAQHTGEKWTTLKRSDWDYLTKTREVNGGTGFGKTCQWVTYNGNWGLIIYCDGYDKTQYNQYATISTDEFPEGCAFLPVVSRRNNTTSIVYDEKYYWLGESIESLFGLSACFTTSTVNSTSARSRAAGLSVRLVSPVSSAGK